MGWGEAHVARTDLPPAAVAAAKRLADSVRAWDRQRSTGREQAMVDALAAYDQAVRQPW